MVNAGERHGGGRGWDFGVPYEMEVGGNARRWWVWVKGTKVAGGLCIHQCEAMGVGFGLVVKNSGGTVGVGGCTKAAGGLRIRQCEAMGAGFGCAV